MKTQSPHTPHGMLSLCSLRSQGPSALARSPHSHASLPASPAVLASLAASPLLLSLRSRLSPLACLRFTRARRLSHLLRALLAPLAASLAALASLGPPLLRARSARRHTHRTRLLVLLSRFATRQLSPAARSTRRLHACRSLRSPLAAPPAARCLTCWFCSPASHALPASPAEHFSHGRQIP